jgi:tetratricopeptide (TPR) repeat protein
MSGVPKRLDGKHVVFTGRLASMPRGDAAALVTARGGVCERDVSKKTAIVIVGQEGWPLRKDGRVSQKLVAAKRQQSLGQALVIVTEEEWLSDLGLHEQSEGIHRRFTSVQLGRLLKLPRQRLTAWIRAGLIEPAETIDGVHVFDFQQVASLRTLWEMTKAGVSHRQLKQSFERLSRWLPNLGSPATLALLEQDGHILVRLDEGLADSTGQLQFDFADDETAVLNPPSELHAPAGEPSADDWYHRGIEFEATGDLAQAARAYRTALFIGAPTAAMAFNLGNALYALGQVSGAAERFRHAVELDHDFLEAWNNLGNALCDLGDSADAIEAFRRALALGPNYADSHYNIAEALSDIGQIDEACEHWRAYLRLEPIGEWAAYARRRLSK